MDPSEVLRNAQSMGASVETWRIVGCEPASLGALDGSMGLSEPIQMSISAAIEVVESLIKEAVR
jgi:Ni,Fe-hydrogenase maturation factor